MPNPLIDDASLVSPQGLTNWITIDQVDPVRSVVSIITRPNVDGVAVKDLGSRGQKGTMKAIGDFTLVDQTAKDDFSNKVRAYQGKFVTVLDSSGTTRTEILITRVKPFNRRPVASPIGGNAGSAGTHRVTVVFEYIDASSP